MKWFFDLKIGKKLLLSFLVVACLAGLIGAIGIHSIWRVNEKSTELYEKSTVPLTYLMEALSAFNRMRNDVAFVLLDNNEEVMQSYMQKADLRQGEVRAKLAKFGKTLSSPKMQDAYQELLSLEQKYYQTLQRVMILGRSNRDDEGYKLLRGLGERQRDVVQAQIDELTQLEVAEAQRRSDENDKTSKSATVLMVLISLFAVALAVIFGIFISRLISKPVARLVKAAEKLTQGDVQVDIESKTKDEIGVLAASFGEIVNTMKEQTAAVERIAAGDLSVEVQVRSEQDLLNKGLATMLQTIRGLIKETDNLARAAMEGRLDTRGKAEAFEGSWGELVQGFNNTLDAVIGPLNVAAEYIDRISKGDIPPRITDTYYGDFNEIKNNLNMCIDAVNALVNDANMLAQAGVEGQLSVRADATKHGGDFGRIITGFNETLNAVVEPLNYAAAYIERMANGDNLEEIHNSFSGDFTVLTNNLNKVRTSLNTLLGESGKIAEAAKQGDLSVRGDLSRLQGGYFDIVKGFNDALDAIIIPLNEAQQVLVKISLNDYTTEMTGDYQGKLKELKESINTTRGRLLSVQDAVVRASKGDTSRLDEFKKIGKRSENDQMMPAMTGLYQTIQDIIDEVGKLSDAGVNGNLQVRGEALKFQGGFQQIVVGLNQTLDTFVAPITEASAVLKEMANGNLQVSVNGDYKGDHAALKESVNHAINSFNEVLSEFNNAAEQVASGARDVSDSSQALSQGSAEQASTVEEITASITEIAAQTKQNAVNAGQANELSNTAKENAIQGNEQMKEMLRAMDGINDSSANISKIIKVIDEIAFQTNILALNAAVEAARAGQHGKGFAVVAEEVRNLAARSANAAKETTALIEGSIKKVEAGTRIASDTAKALDQIVNGVSKATELVGEIATASNEQATAITQINQGINQVSQVTQNNTAMAEQSASASEELAGQAEILKEMVQRFKIKGARVNEHSNLVRKETIRGKKEIAVPSVRQRNKITLDDTEFDKY